METSADSDSNDLSIPASPLQGQRAATVALPAGLVEMSGAGDAKQRIAVLGPAASRWSERDVAGLAGSLPIAQGLAMDGAGYLAGQVCERPAESDAVGLECTDGGLQIVEIGPDSAVAGKPSEPPFPIEHKWGFRSVTPSPGAIDIEVESFLTGEVKLMRYDLKNASWSTVPQSSPSIACTDGSLLEPEEIVALTAPIAGSTVRSCSETTAALDALGGAAFAVDRRTGERYELLTSSSDAPQLVALGDSVILLNRSIAEDKSDPTGFKTSAKIEGFRNGREFDVGVDASDMAAASSLLYGYWTTGWVMANDGSWIRFST
ncbi:hypothetical protein [Candidatus Neomicrothrix sp.]|uniref:hypothetical protein n=1 Tax=Candidatus Neomicrothrix sp. TaxID=2719034 RepID=UPI002B7B528F|nr:hypothetical protein [Candidatus Microthrix sp.]MCB9376190.1 hypothetical protein [Microthrixaceae bacterium]MCB9402077.1 hypothetical protein [Microthrixaceae bacterium]HMS49801.1 hypothetical protein [Candidatus Microthrix sp.]